VLLATSQYEAKALAVCPRLRKPGPFEEKAVILIRIGQRLAEAALKFIRTSCDPRHRKTAQLA
jgi:hypothetical protein